LADRIRSDQIGIAQPKLSLARWILIGASVFSDVKRSTFSAMSDTCPLLEIAAVLWDACHLFMIFTRLKHITGHTCHTWLDILQALAAMKQYQVEKNLPQVDREGIARTAVAKKSGKVSDECKRSPIGSWPAPASFSMFHSSCIEKYNLVSVVIKNHQASAQTWTKLHQKKQMCGSRVVPRIGFNRKNYRKRKTTFELVKSIISCRFSLEPSEATTGHGFWQSSLAQRLLFGRSCTSSGVSGFWRAIGQGCFLHDLTPKGSKGHWDVITIA